MHELGTVIYVIDILEDLAKKQNLKTIGSVTLEVGEVSTFIPEYLTDAWMYSRKKSQLLKESKLNLEMIPAVSVCEDCNRMYPTTSFAKVCPNCKSEHTHLVRGNEFSIKEIEAC